MDEVVLLDVSRFLTGPGSPSHSLMAAWDESSEFTDVHYTDQVPARGMRESLPLIGQQLACSFSP